jgi:hypothetical protein
MGFEIPREIADAEGVPEDLDSNVVGMFRFPSARRRRSAGLVYFAAAAVAVAFGLTVLPAGMLWVGAVLAGLGVYHFLAAFETKVDEEEALAIAGRQVPFSIGHASAALRFEGVRAYPVWNVLVYDADDPPTQRALVFIDAVGGAERRPPYFDTLGSSVG